MGVRAVVAGGFAASQLILYTIQAVTGTETVVVSAVLGTVALLIVSCRYS